LGHGHAQRRKLTRAVEHGMVTAEAALVLPLMALFAMALLWLLSIGIAKVETVDAARDAARLIARGDTQAVAQESVRRAAPAGAVAAFDTSSAGILTVTVSVQAHAPGWLLVPLPAVTVSSSASTPVEDPAVTHG
jgi:hypothetical protein